MTCVPSIVDDILAEIEAEFRAGWLRHDGRGDGHGAASNAETPRVARRPRGPEERPLERFAKEAGVR